MTFVSYSSVSIHYVILIMNDDIFVHLQNVRLRELFCRNECISAICYRTWKSSAVNEYENILLHLTPY